MLSAHARILWPRMLWPRVLHYYVFTEYLKAFAIALLACTFLILLGILIQKASEFESYGVSFGQVAQLSPFFLPSAFSYAIPLSAMIAAIIFFGRLAAENEVLAAQAGGASLAMLSFSVLLCSAVFCGAAFWCNDTGLEWGFRNIHDQVLNLQNPDLLNKLAKPGSSFSIQPESGALIHINMLERIRSGDGAERRPIHITYFNHNQITESLYAEHHTYELPALAENGTGLVMRITLLNGHSLGDAPKFFKEVELDLPLPNLEKQVSFGTSSGQMGLAANYREAREIAATMPARQAALLDRAGEMAAQVVAGSPADPAAPLAVAHAWAEARSASEVVTATWEKARRKVVEFHRKFSHALIPLSMVVLGIGLGLLVRKGQRLVGFVLGILTYFLLYYPLMVTFKELANAAILPPWALWFPNVLILGLGLGLWLAHERGYVTGNLPVWAGRGADAIFAVTARWNLSALLPLRFKVDRHMAGSFLAPLVTVAAAVAVFFVVFDTVEHGNEVVKGVVQAAQPLPGMDVRTTAQAVLDVCEYYGIRGLGMLLDLLPILILIAGSFSATVMVRNNEHLIVKASGTPLQRAFRSLLLAAFCFSLGAAAVRQFVMPPLLLEVDRLKPLVYHRGPKAKSVAGQTKDEQGRKVLYEMALYNRNNHACENLRIYLPEEAADGRIPKIVADRAVWNQDQTCWLLHTLRKTSTVATHTAKGAPDKSGKSTKALSKGEAVYDDFGLRVDSQLDAGSASSMRSSHIKEWKGLLTPPFLNYETLGPAVMGLSELWALRERPEFRSELWRRAFEWLTGLSLLMLCIPLLVRQEIRSPLVGVATCIGMGILYLGMSMLFAELSREGPLPGWASMVPHLFFLAFALWRFFRKMQT